MHDAWSEHVREGAQNGLEFVAHHEYPGSASDRAFEPAGVMSGRIQRSKRVAALPSTV